MRPIVLLLLSMALSVAPAHGATWHIMPDGTGDAPSIQAGVDSAGVGDTVALAAGTYFEHDITIDRTIELRGPLGASPTAMIDGQNLGTVIISRAPLLTLENLVVTSGPAIPGETPFKGVHLSLIHI